MRAGWHDVRVEHVESSGVGDAPEVGATLTVRAFVSLGELSPDDVDVQLVHGVANGEDQLVDAAGRVAARSGSPTRAAGTASTAPSTLDHAAAPSATPCGSCPRNDLLVSPAELGVVALPA